MTLSWLGYFMLAKLAARSENHKIRGSPDQGIARSGDRQIRGQFFKHGLFVAGAVLAIIALSFMGIQFYLHIAVWWYPKYATQLNGLNALINFVTFSLTLSAILCVTCSPSYTDTGVQRLGWPVPGFFLILQFYYIFEYLSDKQITNQVTSYTVNKNSKEALAKRVQAVPASEEVAVENTTRHENLAYEDGFAKKALETQAVITPKVNPIEIRPESVSTEFNTESLADYGPIRSKRFTKKEARNDPDLTVVVVQKE